MPRRVLIVEDEPLLRNGLARLLKIKGHESMTAATIAEGMAQVGRGPSYLVLDMNLPDGVGTTILRHVRAERLPIKVAVLSGSGDGTLMDEARALGPDAMFKKPPDWDALLAWIAA